MKTHRRDSQLIRIANSDYLIKSAIQDQLGLDFAVKLREDHSFIPNIVYILTALMRVSIISIYTLAFHAYSIYYFESQVRET